METLREWRTARLAFRNGDDLIAIIPCFLHHWQGRRQLTLLGSGISDYLEPVISAESMPNVLELLSNYLRGTADWDVVDWQDLSAPTRLTELTPVEFSIRVSDDTPCSEILIAGGWDDFYRERPHGLRRNLRRYADKARQLAEIHFFFEAAFRPGLLENLIRLHAARWNRQGEAGTIASNRSAAFLREIVPKLGAHGRLLFFGLDFQGRTVALILSFPYKGILFSYLSAFDPEYEQYGFGKILLEKSLEYAFQEGFKSWNFLRGKEPYKFEWGSKLIPKCRLILSRVPQS